MNEDCRIEEFEEKPMVARSHTISTGIYVIRRRQLIDLIERCAEEERHDFVNDILIRYKNLKKIYGYKIERLLEQYLNSGCILQDKYGFPETGSEKIFLQGVSEMYIPRSSDLPPAKYNPGAIVKNSLVCKRKYY